MKEMDLITKLNEHKRVYIIFSEGFLDGNFKCKKERRKFIDEIYSVSDHALIEDGANTRSWEEYLNDSQKNLIKYLNEFCVGFNCFEQLTNYEFYYFVNTFLRNSKKY